MSMLILSGLLLRLSIVVFLMFLLVGVVWLQWFTGIAVSRSGVSFGLNWLIVAMRLMIPLGWLWETLMRFSILLRHVVVL